MESYANSEPKLVSFVVRFVYDQAPEEHSPAKGGHGWYAIVRHVQSNTERHFTRWQDVSEFVSNYVDLGKEAQDAQDVQDG